MICPKCGNKDLIGIEYRGTDQDYDGVSEYECRKCGTRIGRWSHKILKDVEFEPRYGVKLRFMK